MDAKRLLNPKEFRERTGRSLKTIYRRLMTGKLPASQEGGPGTAWLIDYEAYLTGFVAPLPESEGCHPDQAGSMQGDATAVECTPPEPHIEYEQISGPQPAWMRPASNHKSKRGHGSKKNQPTH